MEDAWATPLPSRSSASLKRGRSSAAPPRGFRGVRCGPHTTFPRLVCASYEPPEDCVDGL
eukprot:7041148-Prymnesium_polylepis.1